MRYTRPPHNIIEPEMGIFSNQKRWTPSCQNFLQLFLLDRFTHVWTNKRHHFIIKIFKNVLLTIQFNIREITVAERMWLWSTEPNSRLWSKFSKKRKSTWVANPLLWQRYSQRFDVLESKTETMDGRYSKPACFRPSSPEQISPSRSLFCVSFCL